MFNPTLINMVNFLPGKEVAIIKELQRNNK